MESLLKRRVKEDYAQFVNVDFVDGEQNLVYGISVGYGFAALSWASKLQHARAYDSGYLALAERENAWLWTADRRLVNGARQHGFSQIAWIGEDENAESIKEDNEKQNGEQKE
jgi:predicted nucleic acid-binding protein